MLLVTKQATLTVQSEDNDMCSL